MYECEYLLLRLKSWGQLLPSPLEGQARRTLDLVFLFDVGDGSQQFPPGIGSHALNVEGLKA